MSQFGSNPYYQNNNTGGGFLAGGSPLGGSPSSPGIRNRSAAAGSLRPVTAKQLSAATQAHQDAEWKIEEVEFGQVTIVAHIISIQAQTTNNVYWLDDSTGRIEARRWKGSDGDEDSDKWGDVSEGGVFRFVGTLKMFANKRYVNVTNIRPLKDFIEIQYHLLEAAYVTHFCRNGPPGQGNQNTSPKGQGANMSNYSAQGSSAQNDQWAHLPPLQRAIMDFMSSHPIDNDEGIYVGDIASAIGGDASTIGKALDVLMDDGRIYTTSDESHFLIS